MMANDLQHCPECREEYVAGVAACVECGAALQPGPLPRSATAAWIPSPLAGEGQDGGTIRAGIVAGGGADAEQPNRLLIELPGVQADLAARALLLEDIAVRVECQGTSKLYAAGERPAEPFAVTLPVSVHVAAAQYDAAQEILASLQQDDVIGDQWSDRAPGQDTDAELEAESAPDLAEAGSTIDGDAETAEHGPIAESTSLRTVVLLVVGGLVLLLLFGR